MTDRSSELAMESSRAKTREEG